MITLTPKAIEAVLKTYEESNLPSNTYVRLGMKAGGCSGFDVSMEPDQRPPNKWDLTFEQNGVKVVVDKKSHLYLNGTEVDFVMDGFTGGFKFTPPNATASCGCGTSFAFNPPTTEVKKEGVTKTFELSL